MPLLLGSFAALCAMASCIVPAGTQLQAVPVNDYQEPTKKSIVIQRPVANHQEIDQLRDKVKEQLDSYEKNIQAVHTHLPPVLGDDR